MNALVVAISGIIGSGCPALCDELCRKTKNSAVVHFRDYQCLRQSFDELKLSSLRAEVEKLAMNRKYEYVFLDFPLGRCVREMNSVIDFVFFRDIPADLALADAIRRKLRTSDPDAVREKLRLYQEFGYEINRKISEAVPLGADIVLSPEKSLDECENIILDCLKHLLINRYVLGGF